MNAEGLKKEYISKYLANGEYKFYRLLLLYAINKLIAMEKGDFKGKSPELEFLEYHDRFMSLYRREGDEHCLQVACLFRKAGHRVYRIMLKKQLTQINLKFLNLV